MADVAQESAAENHVAGDASQIAPRSIIRALLDCDIVKLVPHLGFTDFKMANLASGFCDPNGCGETGSRGQQGSPRERGVPFRKRARKQEPGEREGGRQRKKKDGAIGAFQVGVEPFHADGVGVVTANRFVGIFACQINGKRGRGGE